MVRAARSPGPAIALAHVGAARRVAVVGPLDEVLRELGEGAVVVRSRDQLAGLG